MCSMHVCIKNFKKSFMRRKDPEGRIRIWAESVLGINNIHFKNSIKGP